MQLNALDRLVAAVDPVRAAARAKARAQLEAFSQAAGALNVQASGEGYATTGGRDPFYRRWLSAPKDAAADTLPHLKELRGQSREQVRNNPIAASAINTNVVRAIGTGLAYVAQPHLPTLGWSKDQSAEWVAGAQAEFSMYADSTECDWRGEQNFYEKMGLTLRSMLESGDVFTVLPDGQRSATMPYALRLQTLEADRVGNPRGMPDTAEIAAGIRRRAGGGHAEAFHVYSRHPGARLAGAGVLEGEWITAVGRSGRRRILHHFKQLRPEMPRGVPYLGPVMGLFKLLGDYTDAEVKAAVVSAFLTVFIESPAGAGAAPVFGLTPTETDGGGSGPGGNNIELSPGAVLGLDAGEKATVANPGRPNPAFGPFVDAVLDQLGAGLFIGSEMLMKKFQTSYTSARAAFLDAWKHLLDMRTLIARSFCQPVLETWMAEAVAIGRIAAPGFFSDPRMRWAYTRAAWRGDSQGSINPKDEVAAYLAARDGRLITNERAEWELFGTDWNVDYPVMRAEHQQMVKDDMLPVPKAGAAAPASSREAEGAAP